MDGRSTWAKMKPAVVKSSLAIYVGHYVTTVLPALTTDYTRAIDRFHCHAMKKNRSKTIQWKKLRNCDVIEDKK